METDKKKGYETKKGKVEMSLLFYATIRVEAEKRLYCTIERVVPKEKIEIYRSIGSLALRLGQPLDTSTIIIILAVNREELLNIFSIRDLLTDIRLILIIPDREKETLSKAHSLSPRFLSYIDDDFTDIVAVLDKMLKPKGEFRGVF